MGMVRVEIRGLGAVLRRSAQGGERMVDGKNGVKEGFLRLLGKVPQDPASEFKHRFRVHQGWWRTAVLLEDPGPHPNSRALRICNTIDVTAENRHKNFVVASAFESARSEITARNGRPGTGIMQKTRLWGNLLSSQPLCFNFWGPLKYDHPVANAFLRTIVPDFAELIDIHFEWAPQPKAAYTDDNSAFDVMVEYWNRSASRVVWGLECKYTDRLRSKPYDKKTYRRVFEASRDVFVNDYDFYVQPSFNQLFRNQLIACAYEQKDRTRSHCGIFCSSDDTKALDIASSFQMALADRDARFSILTYQGFLETMQRLALDWETRKWTMLLWARYLGLELSEETYKAYQRQQPKG